MPDKGTPGEHLSPGLYGPQVLLPDDRLTRCRARTPIEDMHLLHVVGARPNFPKLAPVYRAAERAAMRQTVVHTGQHYDEAMSGEFFRVLALRDPDINLGVGSATHAVQTARIMERFEPVLDDKAPDWVVVYGDVNSTVAAALVASKKGVKVAHVEAGLRSGDWAMPEEVNRVVTDRLADLLLTPSLDANDALLREGVPEDRIVFVGNVMIDSLRHAMPAAAATGARARIAGKTEYVLVTLHRPSNVDDGPRFRRIADSLRQVANGRQVVFPIHPRTANRAKELGIDFGSLKCMPPLSYLEMVDMLLGAAAVVTDSGGVQEETTALGIPCFTLRQNTERPITVTEGTNRLVLEPEDLPATMGKPLDRTPRIPEGWDGNAGTRVVDALVKAGPRKS